MPPENNENRDVLRKILELEQKNYKMLSSIKSSMFWGKVFRTIYWIVIIGAAVGAYYYIEPYVDGIVATYNGFKGDVTQIFK